MSPRIQFLVFIWNKSIFITINIVVINMWLIDLTTFDGKYNHLDGKLWDYFMVRITIIYIVRTTMQW